VRHRFGGRGVGLAEFRAGSALGELAPIKKRRIAALFTEVRSSS
jgi:hypothetical protein